MNEPIGYAVMLSEHMNENRLLTKYELVEECSNLERAKHRLSSFLKTPPTGYPMQVASIYLVMPDSDYRSHYEIFPPQLKEDINTRYENFKWTVSEQDFYNAIDYVLEEQGFFVYQHGASYYLMQWEGKPQI